MSTLSQFIASCFPSDLKTGSGFFQKILDRVSRRSETQPRFEGYASRHPVNQAGMVATERGVLELRAGRDDLDQSIGASIVLTPEGKTLITAPGGLAVSGAALSTSRKPSDFFRFLSGQFQLNPDWEEEALALVPRRLLTNVFVLQQVGDELVPIPILSVLEPTPLYTHVI